MVSRCSWLIVPPIRLPAKASLPPAPIAHKTPEQVLRITSPATDSRPIITTHHSTLLP